MLIIKNKNIDKSWYKLTEKQLGEEYEKIKKDMYYFYDTYFIIKDRKLSREEFMKEILSRDEESYLKCGGDIYRIY